ncbi:hypothetical protein AC20117_23130 (plasmid) [Arthrobacter crystallopoietes]|nr:hypothetical protein AC20117_23130 [Arthrobacter crystallopoietes]
MIPVLLTGLQLPHRLPLVLELGDRGQSNHDRLSAGGWDDAEVRLADIIRQVPRGVALRRPVPEGRTDLVQEYAAASQPLVSSASAQGAMAAKRGILSG